MLETKTAKRKRTPRQKISDDVLDGLMRKYIRLISGGYCKRCKEYVGEDMIEAAHIYKRRRKTVRWDLRNVQPLCKSNPVTGRVGCHSILDNDHLIMTSFMYDILSIEDIKDLQRLANLTLKDYPIDREQIKKDLKEKIKILEDGQPS